MANNAFTILPQPDAAIYQSQAMAISLGQQPAYFVAGKVGWPILLSWLYDTGGIHIEIGLILNALLAAALVPILFATAENLRAGSGRYAIWLLIIMPGWWLWSSTLIREPLIWLLTAVGGLMLVRLKDQRWGAIFPLAVDCIGLAWVRAPLSVLLVSGAAVAILLAKGRLAPRVTTTVVLAGSILLIAGNQLSRVSSLDPSTFGATRDFLAQAGSQFDSSNRVFTYFRVLSGPWPWELLHLGILAIPDVLYLWLFGAILVVGRRNLRRDYLWLGAPALVICAGISVIASNYGLVIRLRAMAMLLAIPVVAATIDSLRPDRFEGLNPKYGSAVRVAARRSPRVGSTATTAPSYPITQHPQ
ncbi:MAG: hypothetical protein ACR2LX_07945 [Jatrophihabitans sp.]